MTSYYDINVLKDIWTQLLKVIMDYFTLDGHFTRVYSHHIFLLNHFRHNVRVSLPFFLMSSLQTSFKDHRKNLVKYHILHEGLLLLIDKYAWALPAPSSYIPTSSDDNTSARDSEYGDFSSESKDETFSPPKKAKTGISPKAKSVKGKGKKGLK